jgi:hypothetical protein
MQFKKTFLLGILLFFFFFIASLQARAATLPSGFTESVYVSGFKQPVITHGICEVPPDALPRRRRIC